MSSATVTRISNDWLGVLPGTWSRFPFQVVFSERKEPSTQTDAHLTPSQKFGVMPQADYMEFTGNRVVLNLTGADNMRHVEPGDFISHLRSFQGGLEYSALSGKVSAAYTVIAPEQKIVPDYFRHLFKSAAFIQALQSTTDQLRDGQSIRFGELKLVELPYPPVDVQRAIADFLDRETAEIDAFVAESEKLITLLNERRAAVITQAVTKGLDPAAPMKDTGIEGVGQVPSHWRVARISWLFGETASGTTPEAGELVSGHEADIPWVTSGELREANLFSTSKGISVETLSRYSALTIHPPGSLLIAMYGATIGRMCILGVAAASNQAVCALRHPIDSNVSFVLFALLAARERLLLDAAGGGQPNINQDKVRAFRLPVPDKVEQDEIVAYLSNQTATIDEAIATAREAIALAKERRQALISAAVTGKIDLRAAA